MDPNKLSDLIFDDDDFFNGVLPSIFNSDDLPDLGDLDLPGVPINEISNVETLGSTTDSTCLESLLKSMPVASCVPPAPNVISTLPGNSVITNPKPVIHSSSYTKDQYLNSVAMNQRQLDSLNAEKTANVIHQLLKTNNDSIPNNGSGSLAAEQKLEVIRQLLDGDNLETLIKSTTSVPSVTSKNSQSNVSILSSKVSDNAHVTSSTGFSPNMSSYAVPVTLNMTVPVQTQNNNSLNPHMTNGNYHSVVASAPALAATLTGNHSTLVTVVSPQRNPTAQLPSSKPVQPVNYANQYQAEEDNNSNFDFDQEESSNDNSCIIGSTTGRGGGRERRSSHNAIEKRYRRSINDKIDELREMMYDQDQRNSGSKMSKSCVLKKALEKMRYLMKENARLREENTQLRSSRSASESVSLASSPSNASSSEGDGIESFKSSPSSGHNSPTYSFSIKTSPVVSHAGSEIIVEPVKIGMKRPAVNDSQNSEPASNSGGNQKLARLLLADLPPNSNSPEENFSTASTIPARVTFFMVSCLLYMFSPLDFLPRDSKDRTKPGNGASRSLLWSDEDMSSSWLITLFHVVQWIIVGFLFVKAVAPSGKRSPRKLFNPGKESNLFAQHWAQSFKDLNKSLWSQSCGQMRAALVALGFPIPVTKLDLWYSILRKICTLPFHGLVLFLRKKNAILRDESCAQIIKADGYKMKIKLQLVQLSLLNLNSLTKLELVDLFLSLWNHTLENRDSLNSDDFIEANITLGMICRKLWPSFGSLSRYFYSSALQQAQSPGSTNRNWEWICNEIGYTFICGFTVDELDQGKNPASDVSFVCFGKSYCLIDHLKSKFRDKLIRESLEATASGDMARVDAALRLLETLEVVSLGAEVGEEEEDKEKTSSHLLKTKGADNKSLWWSRMGKVPILWQKEDFGGVDHLHQFLLANSPLGGIIAGGGTMTSLGETVSNGSFSNKDLPHKFKPNVNHCKELDPSQKFAGAVLLTYRANRRALLGTSSGNSSADGICNFKAIHAVQQAANVFRRDYSSYGNRTVLLWKAISLDWSLNVLASLGSSSEKDLSNFNSILSLLKSTVAEAELDAKKWLLMHEATLRMLSGGNPLRTSLILRQCSSNPNERRLQLVKELVRNRSMGSNGISVR